MALRVVEQAGLTDVGRQRDANEDSYVVAESVFAVADGMGGAQAGEVASRTAAEVFERIGDEVGTPEERLTRLAHEANRRIYDLAQRDASKRGMGTTLTAAMLTPEGVSVGHVGDSRAYRLRGGRLEQLTDDHSLVAELERSGQLSREAAAHHPQKSVITRALGPEDHVDVDTHTHAARPDDVYLLCSDGLTGMISDEEAAAILRGAGSLAEGAEALVRAANQRGGKDNITVVLFRISDDGAVSTEQDTLSASETIHQGLSASDVRTAVNEQERAALRSPSAVMDRASTTSSPASGLSVLEPASRRRRRGLRRLPALVALLVAVLVAWGLYLGTRQVYFLGTDRNGLVTVYRGVPYELPLGLDLYSIDRTTGVPARTVAGERRERLLDHEWRSRGDARDLARQLELGTLDRSGRRR